MGILSFIKACIVNTDDEPELIEEETDKPVQAESVKPIRDPVEEARMRRIEENEMRENRLDPELKALKKQLLDQYYEKMVEASDKIALLSIQSPGRVKQLIPVLLSDMYAHKFDKESRVASGAAYALGRVCENNPEIMEPYIADIIKFLEHTKTAEYYEIIAKRGAVYMLGMLASGDFDAVKPILNEYKDDKDPTVAFNAKEGLQKIKSITVYPVNSAFGEHKNALRYYKYALKLKNEGKYLESSKCFDTLIASSDCDFKEIAYYQKGWCMWRLPNVREALAAFSLAVSTRPFEEAYESMGMLLERMGDVEPSEKCLSMAKQTPPYEKVRPDIPIR